MIVQFRDDVSGAPILEFSARPTSLGIEEGDIVFLFEDERIITNIDYTGGYSADEPATMTISLRAALPRCEWCAKEAAACSCEPNNQT